MSSSASPSRDPSGQHPSTHESPVQLAPRKTAGNIDHTRHAAVFTFCSLGKQAKAGRRDKECRCYIRPGDSIPVLRRLFEQPFPVCSDSLGVGNRDISRRWIWNTTRSGYTGTWKATSLAILVVTYVGLCLLIDEYV